MSLIEPSREPNAIGPDPVEEASVEVEVPEAAEPEVEETPTEVPFEQLPASWQKEVQDLRAEAAARRTAQKEYEAAFDGYTQEEKQAYLSYARLVRAANSGDEEAAAQLAELMGAEEEETPADEPQYLTREEAAELARREAAKFYEEQQSQKVVADGMAEVFKTAEEFGFKEGTEDQVLYLRALNAIDDPTTREGKEKARQMVVNYKQAIIEEYVKGKQGEAESNPALGTGNGVAVSTGREPKTWAEARQSVHERLSNLG